MSLNDIEVAKKERILTNTLGEDYKVTLETDGLFNTELTQDLTDSKDFIEDELDNAMRDIYYNSYSSLLLSQINLYSMRRFDLNASEIKPYKRPYGVCTIDKQFYISVDSQFVLSEKRREYNKKGYDDDLDLVSIGRDNKVFHYNSKLFIDGEFVEGYEIRCLEDKTFIIFTIDTTFTKQYLEEIMSNNSPITVLFMPKTNDVLVDEFNVLNTNNKMVDLFYQNKKYEFKQGEVYTITPTNNYFQIPLKEFPVPTEHILPFANISGVRMFLHHVEIESYYPDIYKLKNVPDGINVELVVFYRKGNKSDKFDNKLSLYWDNTENILQKYSEGTIPDYIKKFKPKDVDYNIKHYRASDRFQEPELYKIEKLQEVTDNNAWDLVPYLETTIDTMSYFLDMKDIDLSSRRRTHNRAEISTLGSQMDFDKPKYLFVFSRESLVQRPSYRFFVDGIHEIVDLIFSEGDYDYIYIDADKINSKTIIELDIIYDYMVQQEFTFTDTNQEIIISLGYTNIPIYSNDLMFINEDGTYVDRYNFNLYLSEEENDYRVPYNHRVRLNNKKVYLGIASESNLNKKFKVVINKGLKTFEYTKSHLNNRDLSVDYLDDSNFTSIAVYINNRLIPRNQIVCDVSHIFGGTSRIRLPFIPSDDAHICVQVLPYTTNQVLYWDRVDNTNGLIDTFGITNKPLSLKWYDFYINGRRIDKNHIDIITPTKAVLKDVKSLNNFIIMENDRDYEIVTVRNRGIDDEIWDNEAHIREKFIKTIIETEENMFN